MFPVDRPPTPSGTKEVSDRFLDAEFFELGAAAEPKGTTGSEAAQAQGQSATEVQELAKKLSNPVDP